jgi:hypothetical protein
VGGSLVYLLALAHLFKDGAGMRLDDLGVVEHGLLEHGRIVAMGDGVPDEATRTKQAEAEQDEGDALEARHQALGALHPELALRQDQLGLRQRLLRVGQRLVRLGDAVDRIVVHWDLLVHTLHQLPQPVGFEQEQGHDEGKADPQAPREMAEALVEVLHLGF